MNELLAQGLQLMGVGMGVVFLFLGLLVGIVSLVSMIIQKGESVEANAIAESIDRDDLLVVLTEAVSRYRKDHSK